MNLFTLIGAMGTPAPPSGEDYIKIKTALKRLGYYNDEMAHRYETFNQPFSPYGGLKLNDDLKQFQRDKVSPTHQKMLDDGVVILGAAFSAATRTPLTMG